MGIPPEAVSPLGTSCRSALASFGEGVSAPWLGLSHMLRHPALWRFGVVPVLLNLLIATLLLAASVGLFVLLMGQVAPWFGDGWGWRIAQILVGFGILAAVLGGALVAWFVVQGIVCGHFYSKLAERVERQLGTRPDELHEVPFAYQVADTLRDVGFLAMANAGCLAVQIVPGVGAMLGLAGGYYFNCFTFGLDFLDHPLALRGMRRREKRAFAKRHRAATLGLGTAVVVISLVPLVNAVLLTTAVTGAVLLHRRLDVGARGEDSGGAGVKSS